MNLEKYFSQFKHKIVGDEKVYKSPYGNKKMIYSDWIASGRLYSEIEDKIKNDFGPYVANTHTETSETGTLMTNSYSYAKKTIKSHVNANDNDVLINTGNGMTGAINKFIRILGLKYYGGYFNKKELDTDLVPLVITSHIEHHSNHTLWLTTVADVIVVDAADDLSFSLQNLEKELEKNKNRKFIIGSFSAASNVTGIKTPYHKMAALMHKYLGYCFIDFAASAPYVNINMHPENAEEKIDAIFFSPHKFLGGPGASGVLIFDKVLYKNEIPDHPGGGTVKWTNAWGEYSFYDDIETREDGGTPGFLQAIRTALAIKLKEKMTSKNILQREEEINNYIFNRFDKINDITVLASNIKDRLSVFSFYHTDLHYNLFVKLLSDVYGIQVRGGCACAGTYGHFLLKVTKEDSDRITNKINSGNLSEKPGWVRLSLHPTTSNSEMEFIMNAIEYLSINYKKYINNYKHDIKTNEFCFVDYKKSDEYIKWFEIS